MGRFKNLRLLHYSAKKELRDKTSNILSLLSQSLNKNRDLFYDSQEIWEELTAKGFSNGDIELALNRIEKMLLQIPGKFWSDEAPAYRSYSREELFRVTSKARGYLWRLKYMGIIDHALEDEIVHKAMNLEDPAGIREIKTVAALTVFGYEHKSQSITSGPDGNLMN